MPNGDTWRRNLRATFAASVAVAGDAIPDDLEPGSGGRYPRQVTSTLNIEAGVMGFMFTLCGHTTWAQSAEAKDFPANAHPSWCTQVS